MSTFFSHSCHQLPLKTEAGIMRPKRRHQLTVVLSKCMNSATGSSGPEKAWWGLWWQPRDHEGTLWMSGGTKSRKHLERLKRDRPKAWPAQRNSEGKSWTAQINSFSWPRGTMPILRRDTAQSQCLERRSLGVWPQPQIVSSSSPGPIRWDPGPTTHCSQATPSQSFFPDRFLSTHKIR